MGGIIIGISWEKLFFTDSRMGVGVEVSGIWGIWGKGRENQGLVMPITYMKFMDISL